MYRKELIDILLNNPLSVHDLAAVIEEPVKAVVDDLQHLHKSLRHTSYQLEVLPAKCKQCGFEFHRGRMAKPGKCPKCRGTWISAPLIAVKEKG